MAWVEKTTPWATHVSVPMTVAQGQGAGGGPLPGLGRSRIQYEGDPPELAQPPGLPENVSETNTRFQYRSQGGNRQGSLYLRLDNQKDLIDNFSTFPPSWFEGVNLDSSGFIIMEDDGYEWCEMRGYQLRDAWQAANPDKYFMGLEWEGWESGAQLGSHTGHHFTFSTSETDGWYFEYRNNTETGEVEKIDLLEGGLIDVPWIPVFYLGLMTDLTTTQYGLQPSYHQYKSISGLHNYAWQMSTFQEQAQGMGVIEPSNTYEFDVEQMLDANAIQLTRGNIPSRVTRAIILMLSPHVVPILRTHDYKVFIEILDPLMSTTYQPPRYRIRYMEDDEVPVDPEPPVVITGEVDSVRRRFT